MFQVTFNSKSVLTPRISIVFNNPKISKELNEELKEIVLKEEPNILKNVPPANADNPDWMTGRLWNYNFLDLDYDAVRELKSFIRKEYESYMQQIGLPTQEVYIQCWVNILRNDGRAIIPHHHADGHSATPNAPQEYSYLSGNLCIQTHDTNTWFRNPFLDKHCIAIPNVDAEMILFPSFVVHWSDKNLSDQPRITISFDIVTEEFYNIVDGKNYRKL